MALYAVYYIANLLINGIVSRDGRLNDWYGFAAGGWGMAVVVALVICAGTFLIAWLLRLSR